ncbi:MAG: UvrD-helicase domain-containing protein [Acidobacteriota bacterium]
MNRPRLSDEESRAAIVSNLDRNLLVEAGAGSGKTHMMAARMAAGIASGKYQIEHMAAVTFTRKAASELRGRFQLALESQLVSPVGTVGLPPDQAARVDAALGNLERFVSGTIHSFCAHLLRERPVESGLAPGFSELDETEDAALRAEAWRDFLAQARTSGHPLLQELRDAGLKTGQLQKAFETICDLEDVEFPTGNAPPPDVEHVWRRVDRFWTALSKLLPASIDPNTTCKVQERAVRFRRELGIANGRRHRAATLAQLLSIWAATPTVVLKWWDDEPSAAARTGRKAKALHEDFRNDVVTPLMDAWRQYLYRIVVTLLTEARATAAAARMRRNTLTYSDLLFKSAKLLRERADVRTALQLKHRWLFVDEFQDTDPVQAEIVFLLAAEEPKASFFSGRKGAPLDWRSVTLRPGALFVVGDPKQSIYRFRRADIEIYNLVRARIAESAHGDVIPLTTNFRSTAALCDWANRVFESQFPSAPTPHSPQYARLEPAPGERVGTVRHEADPKNLKGNAAQVSGVCTLTMGEDVDGCDVTTVEAERIARFIRSEVDAGRRRFGDFLILTRKKTNRLLPYVRALEALQIPMEVSGAGAFAESREVKALALLLRALSDPQDSVSLVGVLRGPLFGVSDRELFAFKQGGGWFSVFCEVGECAPSAGKTSPVGSALASLRQYYRWTRVLPSPAAVERVLEHTGYLALATTTPGGVEAGDLVHAVDRVRQVMERGASLAEAARALETDTEDAGDIESLPLEPGRSAVVRVMNLHKAKGLEARVVFLADPCGDRWRHVSKRVERHADGARGWFSIERDGDGYGNKVIAQPAGWDEKVKEELHYLDAEEVRLRYVAATRARELLVVGRWARPGNGRPWGPFDEFLAGVPELPAVTKVAVPTVQPPRISAALRASATARRESAHTHVREATWSVTSVTAEAKHIAQMARVVHAMPDDPTQVVTADTPARRADAGMAWGSLIHGLLEHAMRHKDASRDDLRRLAGWLTVEEPQLRVVIDEALDTVERAARADFWPVAQSHVHAVEAPFTVADDGRLSNGVIDLLFDSDAGWQVVDYKTDRSIGAGRYAAQLAAYEAALRQVGCSVAGASVVNVRTGSGER